MFITKTEKELVLEYNSKEHGNNSYSGGGIQKLYVNMIWEQGS